MVKTIGLSACLRPVSFKKVKSLVRSGSQQNYIVFVRNLINALLSGDGAVFLFLII